VTSAESGSTPFRPLSAGDLAAWNRAYAGVRPLGRAREGTTRKGGRRAGRVAPHRPPVEGASERAARARLGALVAAGVRFTVERDDGYVRGLREGASEGLWRRLSGRGFGPEATLDLHGMRAAQAERAVHDFVRERHKRGVRYLLLIPGKGAHSEGGVGVLGEVVVRVLTQGGAAPLVQAFTTAHPVHGGRGALAVLLR
jgi:DNA-nicking Smr family endonuclease